jgi:colanic acid/amylovoran biosynthesis glycosyltransferase
MPRKILYLAPALPVLTCTFIYREVFDLRDMGLDVATVSMNTPPEDRISEEARGLLDTTLYLDQVSLFDKVAAFLKAVAFHPVSMARCLKIYLTASPMKFPRDYQRLGYHWMAACYLASYLKGREPDHMHSHFITGATSINMFLSELIGVPFSFTMHASMIWTDPIALRPKLERCKFCISISEYNKQYICETYGEQWREKINIVHCGIPLAALNPDLEVRSRTEEPFTVISVGQLMIRKGFHVLIEAARVLRDRNVDIEWIVVGEGPERAKLEGMIEKYDLHKQVKLVGAQPHEAIPGFLAGAHIFSLPCVIGDDNTRDGIPVALMEAMAWGLPVVSTSIVGLPELIDSGQNGVLVEPDDAEALADAVAQLAASEDTRLRIGKAAIRKIEQDFNSARSARQLADLFETSING